MRAVYWKIRPYGLVVNESKKRAGRRRNLIRLMSGWLLNVSASVIVVL